MSRVLECSNCGRRTFYEKHRCLNCGDDRFTPRDPGIGKLQSITVVHVTPDGVREPNSLGLASFEGGANLIAQLNGDLEIGDTVCLVDNCTLREYDGNGVFGPRLAAAEE